MTQFLGSKTIHWALFGLALLILSIGAAVVLHPAPPLVSSGGFFAPSGGIWVGVGSNVNGFAVGLGLTNYIEFRNTNSAALQPDFNVHTNHNTYHNNGSLIVSGQPGQFNVRMTNNAGGGIIDQGMAVLSGGKATITPVNAAATVTVTNAIMVSYHSGTNAVVETVYVTNVIAGTSFQIASSIAASTNRVWWMIGKP